LKARPMSSWSERFRLGMNMLPERTRTEVLELIEVELPEVKGGRRVRKLHDDLLHKRNRRCNGCKLEILGNVAADLRRIDVVEVVK
jgi:hypothetical protein